MLYRDVVGEDSRPYLTPMPTGLELVARAIASLVDLGRSDPGALALAAEFSRTFGNPQ